MYGYIAKQADIKYLYTGRMGIAMHEYQEKEKENRTGIPDEMKKDFEKRSGVSLDHVHVFRNSPLPERYGALAFSKGDSIYMKPGEERHLAHELVHQIQAAQGMAEAEEITGGEAFNSNPVLEEEADRGIVHAKPPVMQRKQETIQRKIGMEFQTYGGTWNVRKLKDLKDLNGKSAEEKMQYFSENVERGVNVERMLESAGRETLLDFGGGVGYKVTADGPDLEYITNAFDERTDRAGLIKAVRRAALRHKRYTGTAGSLKFVGGTYHLINGADGIYCINKDGEETAHPQATVGIKYEKIPLLIDRLISAPSASILYQEGERPGKLRSNLRKGRDAAVAGLQLDKRKIPDRDRCRAWIQLVEEYLIAANSRFHRDEQRKEKEISAMNQFFAAVSQRLSAVATLAAFPGWSAAVLNFDGERERMNTVADVGAMFSVNQADITKLKTKFRGISVNYGAFCRRDGEIRKLEQQLAAEQQRERQNVTTIRRINGQISVKRGLQEKLNDKLENEWRDFQTEGNSIITAIRVERGERIRRLRELERDQVKLTEVKLADHQRDIFAYLTWYYRKLEIYVGEWPALTKNPEIRNLWSRIQSNTPSNPEKYFKTLLPVKSRTSFYDLYMLLSEPGKTYVMDYINGKYSRDALIYEDKWEGNCISLGEWLDAMGRPGGGLGPRRDIVNYELENDAWDGSSYKRKFDVSRSTDIGHDGAAGQVHGALIELRRLKGELLPDQWEGAAAAVADIVAGINDGGLGAIEAKKKPANPAKLTLPEIGRSTASRGLENARAETPASSLRRPVLPVLAPLNDNTH